jgi:hypothetical protein
MTLSSSTYYANSLLLISPFYSKVLLTTEGGRRERERENKREK